MLRMRRGGPYGAEGICMCIGDTHTGAVSDISLLYLWYILFDVRLSSYSCADQLFFMCGLALCYVDDDDDDDDDNDDQKNNVNTWNI